MPYDLSIPGQLSEFELRAIEAIAALVPPGGHVVEVGALMGRSSVAWARSLPEGAVVTCIDPWLGNVTLRTPQGELANTPETFARHTAGLANVRPVQGFSPADLAGWTAPVDVVFEDSVHRNPVLAENVAFWSRHLAPGGAFCGHDYRPRCPDVVAAAESLAARRGGGLIVVGTLWCALPPPAANPRAAAVAARLRAIAAEAVAARTSEPFPIKIILRDTPQEVGPAEPLAVVLRLCNTGPAPWRDQAGRPLRLRARLRPKHAAPAVEDRLLDIGELPPDIVVKRRVRIPAAAFLPGENAVLIELALCDEDGGVAHRWDRAWPVRAG
jgi:SAM-dependent methyltransferase